MRFCAAMLSLLAALLSAPAAMAQDWSFDARDIAMGGVGTTGNLSTKMIDEQRDYTSIVLPFGLIQVFKNLNIYNPDSKDFDPVRAIEYAASPMHYGLDREVPLSFDLMDDARRHPAEPDPRCPALVIAGRRDDAVPLPAVEHFAAARAGRELVVYDAGHELTEVLEPMWERTYAFLQRFGID